jgi:catechol 2,3-dioxygenase-like lactoylglutathione lyase family enzyme
MAIRELAGVHHVKIPVTDLGRSLHWYRQVFGLRPAMAFPEAGGVVRGVRRRYPGAGTRPGGVPGQPGSS